MGRERYLSHLHPHKLIVISNMSENNHEEIIEMKKDE